MGKAARKIIEIDQALCDGCGECIIGCPEQALQIVETEDGPKARLVRELYCDGLGACLGTCPTGALVVIEKEAEPYDEKMTIERIKELAPERLTEHNQHMEEHADELSEKSSPAAPPRFAACPSSRTMQWTDTGRKSELSASGEHVPSELRQWPIQLHLVAPFAAYFKDANLAFIADCVPFSYANFHQNFVKGKTIVIACPKLDDTTPYIDKIAQIIQIGGVKSIEVVVMEVPCCSGLMHIVREAMNKSGKDIPLSETVITIKGEVR